MTRWLKLVFKAEKAKNRKEARKVLKKWQKSQKGIREGEGGKVTPIGGGRLIFVRFSWSNTLHNCQENSYAILKNRSYRLISPGLFQ